MAYKDQTLGEFAQKTWEKLPAPGGGSVAAAVASLGAALAGMVSNYTTGKKRYAEHEEYIKGIIERTSDLKDRFLELIDEDEKNFIPLSKAYAMKADTEEEKRKKALEISRCSVRASEAVMEVMKLCRETAGIHAALLEKGSVMLLSDVGVGAQLTKAASQSAYLNILINLDSILDEGFKGYIKKKYRKCAADTASSCDRTYQAVLERLQN